MLDETRGARTGRRTRIVPALAGAIISAVALAGCTGGAQSEPASPAPASVGDARIVEDVDCRAVTIVDRGLMPDDEQPDSFSPASTPSPPAEGRVPAGFVPVAAVRCRADILTDGEGRWEVVVTERLEGDLESLLAALAVPDDPPTDGVCPAMGEIVPDLWLVDAASRAMRAHYPRDACGFTKDGVNHALEGLTVADSTTEKVRLLELAADRDAG